MLSWPVFPVGGSMKIGLLDLSDGGLMIKAEVPALRAGDVKERDDYGGRIETGPWILRDVEDCLV